LLDLNDRAMSTRRTARRSRSSGLRRQRAAATPAPACSAPVDGPADGTLLRARDAESARSERPSCCIVRPTNSHHGVRSQESSGVHERNGNANDNDNDNSTRATVALLTSLGDVTAQEGSRDPGSVHVHETMYLTIAFSHAVVPRLIMASTSLQITNYSQNGVARVT